MSTSKLQEQTKERLRQLFSDLMFEENYRPDWLRNPETGYNLELDFWIPDLSAGIEVQGIQHQQYTPFFHRTEANFQAQLERDALKRQLCEQRGVCVYDVYEPGDIEMFLDATARSNPALSYELFKKNCALTSLSYWAAEIARESRKKKPNQDKLQAYTGKVIHIAEKYNVPLLSVRADFELKKIQMAFFGRPVVRIALYAEDGDVIQTRHAAAMQWEPGKTAHLRWFNKQHHIDESYYDVEFDLTTGLPITDVYGDWRIKHLEEIPKRLLEAA